MRVQPIKAIQGLLEPEVRAFYRFSTLRVSQAKLSDGFAGRFR
jgi:hypothetical protein